jgi:hypothetical protein
MQPPAPEALLHLIAKFRRSAWPKQSTGLGARSAGNKPQRMRIKKPPRADTSRSAPLEGKIAAVAMRALHWCLDGRSLSLV